MTNDDIFKEIERTLKVQKEAELKLEMLRIHLEYGTNPNIKSVKRREPKSEAQKYCDTHGLAEDDRELVLRQSMTTAEVVEEINENKNKVLNLLKLGVFRPANDSKPRKVKICAISVYEYLQYGASYGETKEKQ